MSPDAIALVSILTPIGALVGWAIRQLFQAHLRRSEVEHQQRLQLAQEEHVEHMRLVAKAVEAIDKTQASSAASGMMKAVLLERLDRIDEKLGIEPGSADTLAQLARVSDPELAARLPSDQQRTISAARAEEVLAREDRRRRGR